MTQRLNITNGDSAAGTLSEAGVEGKIISWRDVLHEGPVDSSLPLEELSSQRARFIAERRWDDFAHVSGDFAERDRILKHLDYFDEVVLWFEDDLYDQLQLIQLLDFLSRGPAKKKTLTLIQVDGYIPPLSAARLKEMDKKRSRVTAEQLDLARRAWKAFGSDDPSAISSLLDEKTSALPYLASALVATSRGIPGGWQRALAVRARSDDGDRRRAQHASRRRFSKSPGNSRAFSLETSSSIRTWSASAQVRIRSSPGRMELRS